MPWTNNDWTMASTGYTFTNGVPGSEDKLVHRRITAPMACDESKMSEYATKENVMRVAEILPESKYDDLFPLKDDFYTYENFLKAVGKFPHFCNEVNDAYTGHKTNAKNVDEACKRELATLFAHIAFESGKMDDWNDVPKFKQGLHVKAGDECAGESDCDNFDDSTRYPADKTKQYYGRGPLHIVGNDEYGAFSNAFGPNSYDSADRFLSNPDLLETDGYISWASAIWFFMTPRGRNPSMHDVMTNFWIPNAADIGANVIIGFGATTEIINGDIECGTGMTDSVPSATRWNFFASFLGEFNLHGGDVAGMSCAKYWSGFPHGGSHFKQPQYFEKKWGDTNKCNVVDYETPYNIYVEGDYKRCVCDKWVNGAESC